MLDTPKKKGPPIVDLAFPDRKAATALIFPGQEDRMYALRRTWEPWECRGKLWIDEWLRSMIDTEGTRILSREALAERGVECPFFVLRKLVVKASSEAEWVGRTANRDKLRETKAEIEEVAKWAGQLISRVDRLGKGLGRLSEVPGDLRSGAGALPFVVDNLSRRSGERRDETAFDDFRTGFNEVDSAARAWVRAGLEILPKLQAELISSEERLKDGEGGVRPAAWTFFRHLGDAHRLLTGVDPGVIGGSFSTLVTHALNDLKVPVSASSSLSHRRLIELLTRERPPPEWDRFDRLEKRTLPPGVETLDYEAYRAEREAKFEADVIEWLAAPNLASRQTAMLKLLGRWSFAPDDPANADDIARIRARQLKNLQH